MIKFSGLIRLTVRRYEDPPMLIAMPNPDAGTRKFIRYFQCEFVILEPTDSQCRAPLMPIPICDAEIRDFQFCDAETREFVPRMPMPIRNVGTRQFQMLRPTNS